MVYAIVRAGGRQEKVSVGDTIVINRVAGGAGDSIDLAPVLLVDGDKVTSDGKSLSGVKVTAAAIVGVGSHGPVTHSNGDQASYMTVQIRCEPLDPSVEPVVGDDENTEAGWFPVSQMPVTDPKWRLAIGDAAAQRRHPGSFAPRMGLSKR